MTERPGSDLRAVRGPTEASFRRAAALVAVGAGFATLIVTSTPAVGFGYRSPSAQVSLETVAVLVAALVCFLLLGRYRTSGRLDELLLLMGVLTIASTNLLYSTIPAVADVTGEDRFLTWSVLLGRLFGAAVLMAAAVVPARPVAKPGAGLRRGIGGAAALVALSALGGLLGQSVDTGIRPGISPEDAGTALIQGSALLLSLQLLMALLYAGAALGFLRRSGSDELLGWIALGSILAAASRVNYFLFPSVYAGWVYTGDLLRLGFYALLLVGVVRQLAQYRRAFVHSAVAEERRRLARDLHDGLAQELAFISAQTRDLAARTSEPLVERLSLAADRALDESREAIAELTRGQAEALEAGLWRVAEPITARADLRLRVSVDPEAEDPPADVRDAIFKIAREALNNAARHAGAGTVTVTVVPSSSGVRLEVADDGEGFEDATAGFGLTTMRERAELAGGVLAVHSTRGEGTRVEVAFAWPASPGR